METGDTGGEKCSLMKGIVHYITKNSLMNNFECVK